MKVVPPPFPADPSELSHARMGAGDVSLAERLRRRVEELESAGRAAEASVTRIRAEVEAMTAAGRAPEEQASQDRQRVLELESELGRRMEELHLHHHALRQLQADVADREAFIAQFRAQASKDREAHAAARAEAESARTEMANLSARVAAMVEEEARSSASLEQLTAERADLTAKLAAERAQLMSATSQLEPLRSELAELRTHMSSAGFRLVNRISLGLRRHRRIYTALRSIVRKIAP